MDAYGTGSLEEQIAELRSRVRLLEQTLKTHGIVLQTESATLPPAPPSSTPIGAVPGLPRLGAPASVSHKDKASLESRIGSQWFNRIGILAVLIGMAWFLKLAIDNHWIGPLGRVLVGLVAGAVLIAWSEQIRSRGYSGFSYSLKALGTNPAWFVYDLRSKSPEAWPQHRPAHSNVGLSLPALSGRGTAYTGELPGSR